MSNELKACPICQKDNMVIHSEPSKDKSITWHRILHPPETPCGISLIHEDRNKLIDAWNSRPAEPKEQASRDWWCPNCKEALDPSRVTYQERCDTCGHGVDWVELVTEPNCEEGK